MRLPNIPRRGRGDRKSRGQSLVEFALVLPLILMLTLIALDFGRVYLGWINLQSMARIGANLAANNPTAWSGSGDAAIKARYQAQIKNDATANNCRLPVVGGVQTAPAPTFTGQDLGDEAHVALTCTFGIITPGISNILGGSVAVSSSAVFPVKTGMTATDNTAGGSPPNAAFTGNGDVAPSALSGPAPFTVVFRDTSGGSPTSWLWDFNDGSPNSTLQDPLGHVFTVPGTYLVTLTATNSLGSSTATMGVTVTAVSTVNFTTNQNTGAPPAGGQLREHIHPGRDGLRLELRDGPGHRHRRDHQPHVQHRGHLHGLLDRHVPDRRRDAYEGQLHHGRLGLVHGADPQWRQAQLRAGGLDGRRLHRDRLRRPRCTRW